MELPSQLRAARLRTGLTQSELARRAGTSQATLSAYENGSKQPSTRTLERILAAAGAGLQVVPRECAVVKPTPEEYARRGRELVEVLSLAQALPSRHSPELRHPPLKDLVNQ